MSSLIQELENNEALLLMYIADELPAQDRIEVEQMLASDESLRREAERIRASYDFSMNSIASLDSKSVSLSGENMFAVRRACRAMRQWHVDKLSRIPASLPVIKRKLPLWVYSAATAAMLMIAGLIWWGAKSDVIPEAPHQAVASVDEDTAQIEKSFENDASPHPGIAEAETQANSLTDRSDDSAVASSIFLLDSNQ
jgi:anti-sigma factor RsiW